LAEGKVSFYDQIIKIKDTYVDVFLRGFLFLRFRFVKDSFAQTSEIITYEADAQAVFRNDVEVRT